MRLHKPFVLAFCLFVAGVGSLRSQSLIFTLDSIAHGNSVSFNRSYIDSFVAASDSDSILIYTKVFNNSADTIVPSTISFRGALNNSIAYNIAVYSVSGLTLQQSDSTYIVLRLSNFDSILRPGIPTGSSVVIWPVYLNFNCDSLHFLLTYTNDSALVASVGNETDLYTRISCNARIIHIVFENTDRKTIQLYDPIGRKVYDSESDLSDVQIDWSALPASIYVLRIRKDGQGEAIKLIHF
jgi:hypothetical protein